MKTIQYKLGGKKLPNTPGRGRRRHKSGASDVITRLANGEADRAITPLLEARTRHIYQSRIAKIANRMGVKVATHTNTEGRLVVTLRKEVAA